MKIEKMKGKKAPNFKLESKNGTISLMDYKGKKVILYFYPSDMTPGCTIEANDFTKYSKDFKKLNTVILGISKDNLKSHIKFCEKEKLKITLLADPDHKMMESYGVWAEKKFMGRSYMGALRTTFLIDEKGKVTNIWENVKPIGHAKEVLEYVSKLG